MSGVGISFGLDRIYLVVEELGLFPPAVDSTSEVLFVNFGEAEALYALKMIKRLRAAGIKAELYPDHVKTGKQIQYASTRNIPYVVIAGGEEMSAGKFTLKNLESGEQKLLSAEELDRVFIKT
jgi:histidyl-tRNA synthetase